MDKVIEVANNIGLPALVIISLSVIYIITGTIGSLLDFKGKVAPEIINWRRYYRRKREEKEKQKILFEDLQASLNEIKVHYSPEKIAKRDAWMNSINERDREHDESILKLTERLEQATQQLNTNNLLTAEIFVQSSRDRIFDFASKCGCDDTVISKEEFHRIFKVHKKYEDFLKEHNMENGEVDSAFAVIQQAFSYRLKHHSFLEDTRSCK